MEAQEGGSDRDENTLRTARNQEFKQGAEKAVSLLEEIHLVCWMGIANE